jgi:tetratricopeptide (TPR) repeat protein
MDDEEKNQILDLSITQPPEMVEEFLGKIRVLSEQKINNNKNDGEEDVQIEMANETFLRQKLYNYFKRILMELNNPKRKKGQPRMIFTTHLDTYNENQDISFLPTIIQFYVVLNWARKYYEKEDYQRAVEPLRKLIKIKPDFGLGYKWLARSLKKIRKYEDAMRYYEKYAEVDDSSDAWLDLAKSYRKGKIFDKSEEIYQRLINENPDDGEAKIGLAQIKYARNDQGYLGILDEMFEKEPEWLKKWLVNEFNFRIYSSPKTPLSPLHAAQYLGYSQVYELTQRAFRNEVPSHFNPARARMSFYKEELDSWAMLMNRYSANRERIDLYPDRIAGADVKPVEIDIHEDEKEDIEQKTPEIPKQRSSRVEEIIRKIREQKAKKNAETQSESMKENADGGEQPVKRKRGRPPKKQVTVEGAELKKPKSSDVNTGTSVELEGRKKRRGRPRKIDMEQHVQLESGNMEPKPQKRRGRPPKQTSQNVDSDYSSGTESNIKKRRRGRPPKKAKAGDDGGNHSPGSIDLPSEKEFMINNRK